MSGGFFDPLPEIKPIPFWIPITEELIRPPTDEERHQQRLRWEAHRRARASEADRRLQQHAQTLDSATGLRRAVLDLHSPARTEYDELLCQGCDNDPHDDGEGYVVPDARPDWPCRTYRLIQETP